MKIFIADSVLETFQYCIHSKPILLISFSLTPIVAAISELLKIPFLGFNLGIFIFLFLLIAYDFYTGMKAAMYNNEEITSRKGGRSVDKLVSYFMFIIFTALFQFLLDKQGYEIGLFIVSNINIVVFTMIFLWEYHSIGENYKKRYGDKPKIFTLMDKISTLVERKVVSKIEDSLEESKEDKVGNKEINNEIKDSDKPADVD